MSGQGKRKRRHQGVDDQSGEGDGRTNQSLPVADLPPDFDGIPLDGAQYLAVVRQESHTVPAICYVANPYAKVEVPIHQNKRTWLPNKSSPMPSEEWRKQFLDRFTNMRETLASRTRQTATPSPVKIPRGRNGKKWYIFLHGRDLVEEVEYDDDQEEEEKEEPDVRNDVEVQHAPAFHCREPTESLLHHFSKTQIISLLAVLPYWLTQPHVSPDKSRNHAIDPFHSRWLFALLAHLDGQLVGDDISVLRVLARASLACIIQSKRTQLPLEQQAEDSLQNELGAWMIICAIVGIWGQHDLWEEGEIELQQISTA